MTDERETAPEAGHAIGLEIRRGAVLPRVSVVPGAELLSPALPSATLNPMTGQPQVVAGSVRGEGVPAAAPVTVLGGEAAVPSGSGAVMPAASAQRPRPGLSRWKRRSSESSTSPAAQVKRHLWVRLVVLGAAGAAALVAVTFVVTSSRGRPADYSASSAAKPHSGTGITNAAAPAPSWAAGEPSPTFPVSSEPPASRAPATGTEPRRSSKAAPGASTAAPGASTAAPGASTAARGPAKSRPVHGISAASVRSLKSHASNRCIDVTGGQAKDGTPLEIWDCTGASRQKWTFKSDGTVRAMGMCMDVARGSSDDGAVIQLARCHGGPAQHFNLNSAGDLVNTGADKCVDVKGLKTGNGTRLQLWQCAGTSNQKWSAV